MKATQIKIKKLDTSHLDQYNELLRYAFQVTEKTLLDFGWENDEIRKSKFPVLEHANVIGAFDGNTLVSQFAVYPMEMNIHGVLCPIGFVTSVATYPEYSGLGLMSKLMQQSLEKMRKDGQSLSLLYPYSIPLYRHRGWEIISDKMTWRLRDTQVPKKSGSPGYIRRVSEEATDLIELHTRFAKQTHGCLIRNALAWEEYWRWDVDDTTVAVYYGENDNPLGYMVYLINENIFYIKEMIYLNSEAKRGLFEYIAAHDSMIDEVRGNNYWGEPIAFSLPDSEIKESIRPYIMGRIIDIEQFLSNYRFEQDITASITLHVIDPLLTWNNKTYTLTLEGGKASLSNRNTKYEVHLSIGALTTLLLGYKRASELAKLELLTADPETVRILDSAIIQGKPYISDYL